LAFNAIHWSRVLTRIEEGYGLKMSDDSVAKLKDMTETAKKQFRQEKCPTCKRAPQMSWTQLDTETLSRKVGLEDQYLFCFLEPTQLLHCTYYGASATISAKRDIRLPAILEATHRLLIVAIGVHGRRFSGDLEPTAEAAEVYSEWRQVWEPQAGNSGETSRSKESP